MLQFDHLVHFTASPEAAATKFQAHGFHTVMGGKHEKLGTYNTLSYFGLRYIEFIGVFDDVRLLEQASLPYSLNATFVKQNKAQGGLRFALRTTNIKGLAEHFQALGYTCSGPKDFSRKRPDGKIIEWQLLFIGRKDMVFDMPFFIQWKEDDNTRFQTMQQEGMIVEQPAHITGIAYQTSHAQMMQQLWSEHLQLQALPSFEYQPFQATAYPVALQDGFTITFYQPKYSKQRDNLLSDNKIKALEMISARSQDDFTIDAMHYHMK
ncbi:hypothetical protein GCM10007425_07340 [Lysinibacillus alkalisoli]|uniref:Glyoxalase-like domain-containing protein n=1 Tax=Lysinibacillus alkalisoli TaxID=1911548 RepID=A0A917FZQ2_9BACI|nr:VOC family protein [Lysinibacillus alkalisoli]GGG15575.1 hypothetical protein GCM10007425_07340 [Lysinibacillus alkalisoli]